MSTDTATAPAEALHAQVLHALLEGRATPPGLADLLPDELDLVAFAASSIDPDDTRRLAGLSGRAAEAYCRSAVTATLGGAAYVVLPVSGSRQQSDLLSFARSVCRQAEPVVQGRVTAAVGGRTAAVTELARARAEADALLRVLAGKEDTCVATAESLWSDVLLQRLYDRVSDDPDLVDSRIRRLLDHDARRRSDLVHTLAVYLESIGDIPAAAARLRVHQNTLRYRLRRIGELSGFDLDDASDRLLVGLQLRFVQHRQAT